MVQPAARRARPPISQASGARKPGASAITCVPRAAPSARALQGDGRRTIYGMISALRSVAAGGPCLTRVKGGGQACSHMSCVQGCQQGPMQCAMAHSDHLDHHLVSVHWHAHSFVHLGARSGSAVHCGNPQGGRSGGVGAGCRHKPPDRSSRARVRVRGCLLCYSATT